MIKFAQLDEYNICYNCSEALDKDRDYISSFKGVIILEGKNTAGIPPEIDNPVGMKWDGRKWNIIEEEDWSDVSRVNEESFEEICLKKLDEIINEIQKLKKK